MNRWVLNIEGKEKTILNPSWDEIVNVLKSLDGRSVTQADLVLNDGEQILMVGGGDFINGCKRYVVQYFKDNGDDFYILVNPKEDSDEYVDITIEKVGADFPMNNTVDFNLVEKVFQHFYETGKILESFEWD